MAELVQSAVVKKYFTTVADGKNYLTRFYNLDAMWVGSKCRYSGKNSGHSPPLPVGDAPLLLLLCSKRFLTSAPTEAVLL